MYPSLKTLNENLKDAFRSGDRNACIHADQAIKRFQLFWSEVGTLTATIANDTDKTQCQRMQDYFETDDIDEEDAKFIASYLRKLAEEAEVSSDADEGVRILKDFFAMEHGLFPTRHVFLANAGPISLRFVYDEPQRVYGEDWFVESDDTRWLNGLDVVFADDDALGVFYSVKTCLDTVYNMRLVIQHVLACEDISVSEGMYQSIMFGMEFLRDRDNRKLAKAKNNKHHLCKLSFDFAS